MKLYTEYEYLTINGGMSFFNTNIPITQNTRCVAKLEWKRNGDWGDLLGNKGDNSTNSWRLRFTDKAGQIDLRIMSSVIRTDKLTDGMHTLDMGNYYVKDLDSGLVLERDKVTFDDRSYNFLIGTSQSSQYTINCKYYWIKIYDGDTLIADYVPATKYNGLIAFYDKLNDNLIYPQTGKEKMTVTNRIVRVNRLHESNTPLKVTVVKGDNWDSVKAIDFGGAAVTFSGNTSSVHPFSGNASVTSITNATIVNDTCRTLFSNNSGLSYVNVTATCGDSGITRMFDRCPNIQTVIISAPNATKLATNREEHFIGGTHNVPYSISGQFDSLVTLNGISGFSGQTQLADFTVIGNTLPACTSIQSGFIGTSIKTINLTLPTMVGGTMYAFYNCKSLTSATVNMPLQTRFGGNMFQNCSALTEVYLTVSKEFTGTPFGSMCAGCNNLAYLEIVGYGVLTSFTQSTFSIPSDAPCNAHRYCFTRNDGNARLLFTADDLGADTYRQIDCTDDNRTETITADTIIIINDGASYIANPPAGPSSNPNKPIAINVVVDGIYVTTTPSQLSKGKYTWSATEHSGWTKWQDKLWFQYEALN